MSESFLTFLGLGTVVAGLTVAAVLYGATLWRKGLTLLLCLALPMLPLAFPEDARIARSLTVILACLGGLKWVQFTVEGERGSLRYRLWQWLAPIDVREAERVPASLALPQLAGVLVALAVAALALIVLRQHETLVPRPWAGLLAYLAAVVFVVSLTDAISRALCWGHLLVGWSVPPLMDDTWRSESVQAFWGRRWNRTVSRWLGRHFHAPLVRRRHPWWGLLAAFAVSAAIHFYVAWVPLDASGAMMMASFFLVQPGLILIERRFIPRRLRRPWAYFALLVAAPLFIAPVNAVLLGRGVTDASIGPMLHLDHDAGDQSQAR